MKNKKKYSIHNLYRITVNLLVLTIILLLTACSSGGDDSNPIPQKPELVQMPSVVGIQESTALANLTDLGLEVSVDRANQSVPIGEVVGQNPAAGAEIEVGMAVAITVSAGVSVPDLVGMPESDASQTLADAALALSVSYENNIAPIDEVVSQSISTGTNVDPGTTVDFVVSNGIAVPGVIGMSRSEARTALTDRGFAVVENLVNNTASINTVINQDHSLGTNLNFGATVTITVSNGITVPDVTGLDIQTGRTTLTNLGFRIIENRLNNSAPIDNIFNQSPAANTNVNAGTTVTLIVSDGIVVPNVIGMNNTEARTVLTNLGFSVSENRLNNADLIDTVINQDHTLGTNLNFGATITITVSNGIAVPNVVGQNIQTARTTLTNLGLAIVENRQNDSAPIDNIINQNPSANTNVNAGTTVTLIVSDGIAVPDVVSMTEIEARTTLTDLGFSVSANHIENTVPIGQVFNQNPLPGVSLNLGSVIVIDVSTGILVPNIVGMSLADGKTQLIDQQLVVNEIRVDSVAPIDTIIAQSIVEGANVNAGTVIEITISNGLIVPDVVGIDVADARTLLEGIGFSVTVNQVLDITQVNGQVFDQNPGIGTQTNGTVTVALSVFVNKLTGPTACLQDSASLVSTIALADAAKGGKIYDKWWTAISTTTNPVPAPTTDHPMWIQQTSNTRSGAGTWQCKECHGWDYKGVDGVYGDVTNSHHTGFTGIFDARTRNPIEVYCAIHSGTEIDANHNFSGVLTDIDILHLTKFITSSQGEIPSDPAPKGVIDVNTHISAQGTPIGADPANGEALFTDNQINCASSSCHGTDGTTQHISIGELADVNPWQTLHKIRFGHPGSNMPAFSSPTMLTIQQSLDIIAFAQNSLPNPQSSNTCLTDFASLVSQVGLASAVRGARMYDNWWIEAGVTEPTADHPLWISRDQPSINTRTGSSTWRCKECHGWDYKGFDGVYGDTTNDHYTGFAGVMAALNKQPIDVFCSIRSGTGTRFEHRFSPELSDINILHITKFLVSGNDEGLIDTSAFINDTGTTVGSSTVGEILYEGANGCSSSNCHGLDGTAQFEFLGNLSSIDPWLAMHKIRFGHPGAIMPAYGDPTSTVQLSLANITDVISYTQTLPLGGGGAPPPIIDLHSISRGGRLYDNWITETGAPVPPVDNPVWALQSNSGGTNTRTGATTWRCKECHGWDYKGVNGVYGDPGNSHFTGFGGVFSTEKTEAQIIAILTNGFFHAPSATVMHNFEGMIQPADIEALAKFIKQGTIDTSIFFGLDGMINGSQQDFLNGLDLYNFKGFGIANGNCELCHDSDGKGEVGAILGFIANTDPWRYLHKVRFGQPNTTMPALINQLDPISGAAAFDTQDAVDITHFSQSLPTQ